jgi:sensor domain CHASE-containing protein
MKLRIKTLAVLVAAMICLTLVLYGISTTLLIDGFKKVEQKEIKENLIRTNSALSVEISQVNSTTRDYSGWDDTYQFIQDQNPEYIEGNLVDETFISLKMNMMVFVNNSKDIVFKKEVDLVQGNETTFPEGFLDLLTADSPLLQHTSENSNISGIVNIPEGPILIASYPILDSTRKGPIMGTLIFGRNLDTSEIEYLSMVTRLDLKVYIFNDPHLPSDLKQASSSLSNDAPTFIKPLNEKKIAGYILINDVQGKRSLIFKVTADRDVYNQGKTTMNYFLIAVIISCIIIGNLLMGLMEVFVLRRLRRLSSSIDKIGTNEPNSKFVDIDGKDEFAVFSKALRGKLESLNIIPVHEITTMIGKPGPSGILLKTPDLQPGKIYFVDEKKADLVFRIFNSMLGKGYEGLCVTRMAPKKVREEAYLEKTPIVWLSTTASGDEKTIDPSAIARIHSTVQEFLTAAKQPIILIEGVEYLIFVNNFRYVLTMLHSLYERTVSSNGILLLVLSKQTMTPAEWSLLTKDMEEIDPTPSKG